MSHTRKPNRSRGKYKKNKRYLWVHKRPWLVSYRDESIVFLSLFNFQTYSL